MLWGELRHGSRSLSSLFIIEARNQGGVIIRHCLLTYFSVIFLMDNFKRSPSEVLTPATLETFSRLNNIKVRSVLLAPDMWSGLLR